VKPVLVAIACLALMSTIPALAAPRQIEDYCFEKLQQATIPLRRGAGEAFMANCIATSPQRQPKSPITESGDSESAVVSAQHIRRFGGNHVCHFRRSQGDA
jgi:hypothetical protein